MTAKYTSTLVSELHIGDVVEYNNGLYTVLGIIPAGLPKDLQVRLQDVTDEENEFWKTMYRHGSIPVISG